MYPPITVYPGGAAMVCEDVEEFDPNVAPPEAPPAPATPPRPMVPENPMPAAEEKLDAIKKTGALTYNPVAKLISRLDPIYKTKIEPLITMDVSYGEPAECARRVTSIREAAFDAANMLRACIVKYAAVADLVSGSELCHDIIAPCAKMIIMGGDNIPSEVSYTFDAIPGLGFSSEVMGLIAVIIGTPSIQEMNLSASHMRTLLGHNHDFADTFGGIDDFLSILFDEPGRIVSISKQDHLSMSLENLIVPPNRKCHENGIVSDEKALRCSILKFISYTLRDISMRCYDLWCSITDGSVSQDVYSHMIGALSRRTVNMFAIGSMVALFYAGNIGKEVSAIEATMTVRDRILAAKNAKPAPPENAIEGGPADG